MAVWHSSVAKQVGAGPTGGRKGLFFCSVDIMVHIDVKGNFLYHNLGENTNINTKSIFKIRREMKKVVFWNAFTKFKTFLVKALFFLLLYTIYHNHIQIRVLKGKQTLWLPSELCNVWEYQIRIIHLTLVGGPTHSAYYTLFFPQRHCLSK